MQKVSTMTLRPSPFGISRRLTGVCAHFMAVVLLAVGAAPQAAAVSDETTEPLRFPQVEGRNLEGQAFTLPAGFAGEANLAIVAFQRWHQDLVDPWIGVAKEIRRDDDRFRFYELPTIYRGNPLFRLWLDRGMASGIPDVEARRVTITLYLDKAAFRSQLAIPDEKTIHLFLLRDDGSVAWRTEGELTDDKADALRKAVANLLGPAPKPAPGD